MDLYQEKDSEPVLESSYAQEHSDINIDKNINMFSTRLIQYSGF